MEKKASKLSQSKYVFFIECNRKIFHASKVLISYVNTKAFNKNNISEAVGCATKKCSPFKCRYPVTRLINQ